jgi:hypothetical protein
MLLNLFFDNMLQSLAGFVETLVDTSTDSLPPPPHIYSFPPPFQSRQLIAPQAYSDSFGNFLHSPAVCMGGALACLWESAYAKSANCEDGRRIDKSCVCECVLQTCPTVNNITFTLPFLATFSCVMDPDPVGSGTGTGTCPSVAETAIGCKD